MSSIGSVSTNTPQASGIQFTTGKRNAEITKLKEEIASLESQVSDSDSYSISESPKQEIKQKDMSAVNTKSQEPTQGRHTSIIKSAIAAVAGFTTGIAVSSIQKNIELAQKEDSTKVDKTEVSPEKNEKESVAINNNVEELSSDKVKGFNVRSGELPDGNPSLDEKSLNNGPFKTFEEKQRAEKENEKIKLQHSEKYDMPVCIRHDIEGLVRGYATYDENSRDKHKEFPGDVCLEFNEEAHAWSSDYMRTNVDISFDPESNILKSFNMKIKRDWECRYSHDKDSSYSVEDKGSYILYKRDDGDQICHQKAAVKYDKKTHKTTYAGFLDKLL